MTDAEDRNGEPEAGGLDDDFDREDLKYQRNRFARELQRLKSLDGAHRRGYGFQDFIGTLFKQRHFKVVPSPGTARPRQTDLLATRGDDAYLIETKWRKSKADIDDMDALFNRLASAPASVTGLMVSFSGFTSSAIERTVERSDRPVVLMTGAELEQLVDGEEDLVLLLAQKKASLVTHRKALFGPIPKARRSAVLDGLAIAPGEFAFVDGTRAKWVVGGGGFGEFTFVQELPDIDWVPGEGHGVTLDMPVPIYEENGIIELLHHLSNMGWATGSARWSIQQATTNWHGMGASAFVDALRNWRKRYKGISIHHSEEFCYFDVCDGGFYSLTANLSSYKDRAARYTLLSFQLTGIPLDTGSLRELSRTFNVGYSCNFRPKNEKSVRRIWGVPEPYRAVLEPVAFLVERDDVFNDDREWARGLVVRNPFYRPESTLAERKPDWLPAHVFDSELLICDLRSWHPLDEPKQKYELWGCESTRTTDAVIVHPIAEWPK